MTLKESCVSLQANYDSGQSAVSNKSSLRREILHDPLLSPVLLSKQLSVLRTDAACMRHEASRTDSRLAVRRYHFPCVRACTLV